MKRSKTAILNELNAPKPNSLLRAMVYIGIVFIIALVALWHCKPAFATNQETIQIQTFDDYQKAKERELGKAQWNEERGELQPNLSPTAEKELRLYTAQKQAEINKEWK